MSDSVIFVPQRPSSFNFALWDSFDSNVFCLVDGCTINTYVIAKSVAGENVQKLACTQISLSWHPLFVSNGVFAYKRKQAGVEFATLESHRCVYLLLLWLLMAMPPIRGDT